MKILVANHWLSKLGGSETFTYTLIEELVRLGHEVDLFTFFPGLISEKIERDFGVNINVQNSYDIIFASHNTTVDELTGHGFIIQTCHGVFPYLEQPSEKANLHVSITKEVKDHLARLGFDSKIIWNGVNCNRFKPTRKINKKLKTVLSLAKSEQSNIIIRQACQVLGLDYIERRKERIWNIENEINKADLVISLGRGVYESLACGRSVLVYDHRGYSDNYGDGIITEDNINLLMENNCSGRYFKKSFTAVSLANELKKYDPGISEFSRNFAVKNLNIKNQVKKYIPGIIGNDIQFWGIKK